MKNVLQSWFLGRLLALLIMLGFASAWPARADELVRRVQEELRKRSLYFGDVDGTFSPPIAAAVRRYQQRKGFPATGQLDAVTLDSLMIPLPPAFAAAPEPSALGSTPGPANPAAGFPLAGVAGDRQPWPDVTVLRSDEGRRQPTAAGAAAQEATPPPTTPPRPPPAAATRRKLSTEEARAFIQHYLRAGETNNPASELAFYGERVDYFNEGVVDHRFIAGDITRYDRRWPERRFTLLEPFSIAPSPDGDPGKTVVNFRYQFSNQGSKYLVRGKTDNSWTLTGESPADVRIIALKEQRVRE